MSETHSGVPAREVLSLEFVRQMYDQYPDHAPLLADPSEWKAADLPHQPGQTIAYARLGDPNVDENGRPLLIVSGFGETLTSRSGFALEFASQGFDTLVVDTNRGDMQKDPETDTPNAALTTALDYMAVLEAEGLTHTSLDVVAHSYASLVFQEMLKLAKLKGWTCFDGSDVVMTAPAGFRENETRLKMFARNIAQVITEKRAAKQYKDVGGDMDKSVFSALKANIRRSWREFKELGSQTVDVPEILDQGVNSLHVLAFARDRLIRDRELSLIERLHAQGVPVGYSNPYSVEPIEGGKLYGIEGSTHADGSFNPNRVVSSIAQILSIAKELKRADSQPLADDVL